ncbi:Fis family transcriptional regulator [Parashewanella curva]|uniref:Fis family transcriptional regulator n=1 Tax=Parashewanella curva TaxID=2338552 RepID=A0A3L8PRB9_9GAMM|nr:SoxR reducing system RseC family protein [Parashewanella curva]RLV57916.1 Fis family transcriptional regulator [Parashewanella curva]
MMEEKAKVVSEAKDGWVMVEVESKSACHSCHNEESCGTSAVAKAFTPKTQVFSIETYLDLQPNEVVKIGLPESVVLKAAALVYLLPLAGFFIMAGLATLFLVRLDLISFSSQSGDLPTIIFGGLGAVIAWFLGRKKAKELEQEASPVIIERLGQSINTPMTIGQTGQK